MRDIAGAVRWLLVGWLVGWPLSLTLASSERLEIVGMDPSSGIHDSFALVARGLMLGVCVICPMHLAPWTRGPLHFQVGKIRSSMAAEAPGTHHRPLVSLSLG